LAAPTAEDREKADGSNYTWGDYAKKVVSLVVARNKHVHRIICLNDAYNQKFTVKDSERMLLQKRTHISNIYMKSDDKLPATKGFHNVLGSSSNKICLQTFLQTEFQRHISTTNIEIIYYVVFSCANNLTTGKSVPEFACSHAEADTAMFTIYNAIRSQGYTEAVVLDTGDTDNYVQAAYVAHPSGIGATLYYMETSNYQCTQLVHR
jgi:hypothetical protein